MKKNALLACLAGLLLFPVLLPGQDLGLIRLQTERPASEGVVSLWGGAEEGGFRPAYSASLQATAGASAKGARHNGKSSWTGAVSFEHQTGLNMFSSLFMEPGYFPMDILEFTRGTKNRETGRLEGGYIREIGYDWAAGIKVSGMASYASKQQDLRHSDFGAQVRVEPTFTYITDDDAGFAFAYIFRLRAEYLSALPGSEAGAEYAFLDKGMRYGTYQDVFTPDGSGKGIFSVVEPSHGGALKYLSPEVSFGGEMLWKRGKAGGDRFAFPGSSLSLYFGQILEAEGADHCYNISYDRSRDQLREGGRGVSDRRVRGLDVKYEVRPLNGIVKSAAIDLDADHWKERAMPTPSLTDGTNRYVGTATLSTKLSYRRVDLDLNVLAGKGWWKDRGRTEEADARLTDDWLRKMDYLMASHIGMGGTLTYRLASVPGLDIQLYGYWHHAFNTTRLPGKNREIGTLKINYRF